MRIDAHCHFWNFNEEDHSWISDEMKILRQDFLPGDFQKDLRVNDVQGVIAVQAAQTMEETRFLLDLAEHHEYVVGVVGWIDLQSDRLEQELQELRHQPYLQGFRHIVQDETDPSFLKRSSFINGVSKLRDYGFAYDLLVKQHQLAQAVEFVSVLPDDLPIVLDHLAKPDFRKPPEHTWIQQIRQLGKRENMYCKLSGMVTEHDWNTWEEGDFYAHMDVILEAFGPSRVLIGSDWPVCQLAATYDQVYQIVSHYFAGFSTSERRMIFGENAMHFYSISANN